MVSLNYFAQRRRPENHSYSSLGVITAGFFRILMSIELGVSSLSTCPSNGGSVITSGYMSPSIKGMGNPWVHTCSLERQAPLQTTQHSATMTQIPRKGHELPLSSLREDIGKVGSLKHELRQVDPTSWCRPTRRPADAVGEQGACVQRSQSPSKKPSQIHSFSRKHAPDVSHLISPGPASRGFCSRFYLLTRPCRPGYQRTLQAIPRKVLRRNSRPEGE